MDQYIYENITEMALQIIKEKMGYSTISRSNMIQLSDLVLLLCSVVGFNIFHPLSLVFNKITMLHLGVVCFAFI